MNETLAVDIEVYTNYFLCAFRGTESGIIRTFEQTPDKPLDFAPIGRILRDFPTVGFNSINYDLPILQLAVMARRAPTCEALKEWSDMIIQHGMRPWQMANHFGIKFPALDHIDLIEVAPGVQIGLKMYAARMHCERLQELPIEPSAMTTERDRQLLKDYCVNSDLVATIELYKRLKEPLALRARMSAQYGIELRSKSDAQMAEAVIRKECERISGKKIFRDRDAGIEPISFKFVIPSWVTFKTSELKAVAATIAAARFETDINGYVKLPKALEKLPVTVNGKSYKLGIGGLHSTETRQIVKADAHRILIDRDVASYYPAMISNAGIYPELLGPAFKTVYNEMLNARLKAKKEGRKSDSDSLKVSIVSSFGKLGSPYSLLYSPELLIQVTMTGQLALLMLIEAIELSGNGKVISANTDGVTVSVLRDHKFYFDQVIAEWEHKTKFVTEETQYSALYSRDVNNYIAIKTDGTVKTKGIFTPAGLTKNPNNEICVDAVIAYLKDGKPVEQTIRECKDIRKFLTVRRVTGGALKCGNPCGKVIRYTYSSIQSEPIVYAKNGNKVPLTDSAEPWPMLPFEFPEDLWYERYVKVANDMLLNIGFTSTQTNGSLDEEAMGLI